MTTDRDDTFERSTEIGKLAAALAKAQGQIEHASKDRVNTHFGSKYADLASVIDAIREALSTAGIARHQATMSRGTEVGVRTMLVHAESAEFMASTIWITLPDDKRTPQAIGSVLTYLRRYSLAAAVGLAQDDDDVQSAMGSRPSAPPQSKAAPPKPPAPAVATDKSLKELWEAAGKSLEWISKQAGREVKGLKELTQAEVDKMIKYAKGEE